MLKAILPAAVGLSLYTEKGSSRNASIAIMTTGVAANLLGFYWSNRGLHEKAVAAELTGIALDTLAISLVLREL
jgi:hypothetical protein